MNWFIFHDICHVDFVVTVVGKEMFKKDKKNQAFLMRNRLKKGATSVS